MALMVGNCLKGRDSALSRSGHGPKWYGTCEIWVALGSPRLPREAGLTGSMGTERTIPFLAGPNLELRARAVGLVRR
ncbi:MAG: hypothetical protein PVH25_12265, partial [Burkholderiales bacterium]